MKPTLIHSKILNETIYLFEEPVAGQVCYSEKEIKFLKACEKNMKPERYSEYLRKVHLVKKTFPGSKIEEIKMGEPAASPEPVIEEPIPIAEPPKQKSLWED